MNESVKVVGIDAAFAHMGIVTAQVGLKTLAITDVALELIVTDSEDRKTVRRNSDDLRRARVLREGILRICDGAVCAIAEVPVGSQSARASWTLGIVVGVLAGVPVPLIEVTPSEVKLVATGSNKATKAEMIAWAVGKQPEANWKSRKQHGRNILTKDNEHLADALAAVYAGVQTPTFAMLRQMHQMAA
jgi:Holliday junction resolvasome RuvABC endonuclease subunit